MKAFNEGIQILRKIITTSARSFLVAGLLFYLGNARGQSTQPLLTIKPSGTNQFSIGFTNNIGLSVYDLEWTPVLASPDYPWTFAAIGVPGSTNFLINEPGYSAAFFRTVLDTNTPPLWESSNPDVPNSPILQVFIYNPANGAVLQ